MLEQYCWPPLSVGSLGQVTGGGSEVSAPELCSAPASCVSLSEVLSEEFVASTSDVEEETPLLGSGSLDAGSGLVVAAELELPSLGVAELVVAGELDVNVDVAVAAALVAVPFEGTVDVAVELEAELELVLLEPSSVEDEPPGVFASEHARKQTESRGKHIKCEEFRRPCMVGEYERVLQNAKRKSSRASKPRGGGVRVRQFDVSRNNALAPQSR